MLAVVLNEHYISEQDYLDGEQVASVRHEYVAGKVYAMAGASLRHNDIALNTAFALRNAARGTRCRVNVSDVKVRAEKSKAYFYPDVVVSCEAEASTASYVEHPCLIVEVTSKSTEWKDQHEKSLAYRHLTSLQTYLLIAQDRPQVTLYYRDADGAWEVALYEQLEQTITLPCPAMELSVAAIYEGVDFTQMAERRLALED